MLPNNHPSLDVRLAQLLEAIKVVYASTFFQTARDYLETTPYRIEEELMAVLVQRLVGSQRGDRFYPTFCGGGVLLQLLSLRRHEARGWGRPGGARPRQIGGRRIRSTAVLPSLPADLPQFSAVKDVLRNAQRRFYALDMSRNDVIPGVQIDANLLHEETSVAVRDGAVTHIASTYDRANDRIVSGLQAGGAPLISFDFLLRGRIIPLPEILATLLDTCQKGLASPAEIEFAAEIDPRLGRRQTFNVLQLRPMVFEDMDMEVDLDEAMMDAAVVRSEVALGHGRRETISDIIVVDPAPLRTVADRRRRRDHRTDQPELRREDGTRSSSGRGGGAPATAGWASRSPGRRSPRPGRSSKPISPTSRSSRRSGPTSSTTSPASASPSSPSTPSRAAAHQLGLDGSPADPRAVDGRRLRHIRLDDPAQVLVDGSSSRGVILGPED